MINKDNIVSKEPGPVQHEVDGERVRTLARDGEEWWRWDGSGVLVGSHADDPDDAEMLAGEYLEPFLDPMWIARYDLEALGRCAFSGRPAVGVRARHGERSWSYEPLPGADEYRLLLDADRGIVLRIASYREGELLDVEELLNIRFDEPLPPDCFEAPRVPTRPG